MVEGHLGHSNHEIIKFSLLGKLRNVVSRTAVLNFWRTDFGLIDRVPCEEVLEGKGVQEGWTFFKNKILKKQEEAVSMC